MAWFFWKVCSACCWACSGIILWTCAAAPLFNCCWLESTTVGFTCAVIYTLGTAAAGYWFTTEASVLALTDGIDGCVAMGSTTLGWTTGCTTSSALAWIISGSTTMGALCVGCVELGLAVYACAVEGGGFWIYGWTCYCAIGHVIIEKMTKITRVGDILLFELVFMFLDISVIYKRGFYLYNHNHRTYIFKDGQQHPN